MDAAWLTALLQLFTGENPATCELVDVPATFDPCLDIGKLIITSLNLT